MENARRIARSGWTTLSWTFGLVGLAAFVGTGCEADLGGVREGPEASRVADQEAPDGLSDDFREWLDAHGYDAAAFARDDLEGGSFGGRAFAGEALAHDPVIFVHGNGDQAWGDAPGQTGWAASYADFLGNGYSEAELYATTWGPADVFQVAGGYHSRANVTQVREFIVAVKAYTGAAKVDIVAHSMGVTLARKAILGGVAHDSAAGGTYEVGPPLGAQVDTFVAIAGTNLGLVNCYLTGPTTPTCGSTNGLYPGWAFGTAVIGRSAFLENLLQTSGFEGSFRYSMWSTVDEIIGYGNLVYGSRTSRLRGQTGEVVFSSFPYGHFGLKDLTTDLQLELVDAHQLP